MAVSASVLIPCQSSPRKKLAEPSQFSEPHQSSSFHKFGDVAFEVFGGFQAFAAGCLAFRVAGGIRFLDLGFRFHGDEDRSSPLRRVPRFAAAEDDGHAESGAATRPLRSRPGFLPGLSIRWRLIGSTAPAGSGRAEKKQRLIPPWRHLLRKARFPGQFRMARR